MCKRWGVVRVLLVEMEPFHGVQGKHSRDPCMGGYNNCCLMVTIIETGANTVCPGLALVLISVRPTMEKIQPSFHPAQ